MKRGLEQATVIHKIKIAVAEEKNKNKRWASSASVLAQGLDFGNHQRRLLNQVEENVVAEAAH